MTLTKSQKIYGAFLVIAAGAFAWDRATNGGASPAQAGAATAETPVLLESGTALAPGRDAPSTEEAMGLRLASLARERCLDLAAPENAFAPVTEWSPPKAAAAVAPVVAAAEADAHRKLAESFRTHHLDGVIVGHRGYASVDGQGVFVGEAFDRFTLLSVTRSSAIFDCEGVRVELHLAVDSKINRKGGVIENASPRSGDAGPHK